jgi:hypothetical protein
MGSCQHDFRKQRTEVGDQRPQNRQINSKRIRESSTQALELPEITCIDMFKTFKELRNNLKNEH